MDDFDFSTVDAQDEAALAIKHPKTLEATTWLWTFYGPAHPKTVELANSSAREVLREQNERRQAQFNNKKVKVDDPTELDVIRAQNVENILKRTKSFTPATINGEKVEFSPEKAKELLLDRRKGWLYSQITEFLKEDESFIQPSAKS